MSDSASLSTAPEHPRRWWKLAAVAVVALTTVVVLDYSRALPETVRPNYVGRNRCITCHQQEHGAWKGSHHDLAMDLAADETVLGDFGDAKLEHFGITSTMFKRDGKFMVNTEGPDGAMADFEVKYVFGVEPLQQYMVEFDRQPDQPENEVARVQVLRITWDTRKKRWFYLSPPDVNEKLSPDDDLHWTGIAQRWNNMCADCHSTNVRRGFNAEANRYHTTFSEIDVSCEACHGPGSVHVELANRTSLFWDRKRGYGLARLKDQNSDVQITACAPCHARRRVVKEGYHAGDNFYDHFAIETLSPQTYHCDGQILDEVYVTGSFLQSKMYHKGIRCTDCHDPHTATLKHEGNRVCTSCHQHSEGRYDNPAHHFHQVGSEGAKCVNCHMPSTTYMDVDPRRDHSLRIPRPDLSVELGSPNACSGCHLDKSGLTADQTKQFSQYKDWLLAARPIDGSAPNQAVAEGLRRVDQWATEQCDKWYGEDRKSKQPHYGEGLHAAWSDPESAADAIGRWMRFSTPALIRSSMLDSLVAAQLTKASQEMVDALSDSSPSVRASAIASFENLIPGGPDFGRIPEAQVEAVAAQIKPIVEPLWPLLADPVRSVRAEAARVLSRVPPEVTPVLTDYSRREQFDKAFGELKDSLMVVNDRGGSHAVLGSLYENLGLDSEAASAYRMAIAVEPRLAGPRTNLAAMHDRRVAELEAQAQAAVQQRQEAAFVRARQEADQLSGQAAELRKQELPLLQRDANLAPNNAAIQHRLGMCLYLNDDLAGAEQALRRAVELEGDSTRYLLMLALLLEKLERFNEAAQWAKRLTELAPEDQTYRNLRQSLEARVVVGPQQGN
ncbi:MAG: hypothetical protein KDB14_05200 [Planctomycetales bacterium]|nr:hypothetical protein [Planctomycetales bacterium]